MHYDIFPHYDIGDLVRVSYPRSEDGISDSVHSSKSNVPSEGQPTWNNGYSVLQKVMFIFLNFYTEVMSAHLDLFKMLSHQR